MSRFSRSSLGGTARGCPAGWRGEQISLAVRLWQVADVAEVHQHRAGTAAAVEVVTQRRDGQFDPAVVNAFTGCAEQLFGSLPERSSWDDVVATAPPLRHQLTESELDGALEVLADYADLKSPWFGGHSRGVAALAAAAARRLGLDDDTTRTLHRAGLVHDLARIGVPNTVWDKAGPLTPARSSTR